MAGISYHACTGQVVQHGVRRVLYILWRIHVDTSMEYSTSFLEADALGMLQRRAQQAQMPCCSPAHQILWHRAAKGPLQLVRAPSRH